MRHPQPQPARRPLPGVVSVGREERRPPRRSVDHPGHLSVGRQSAGHLCHPFVGRDQHPHHLGVGRARHVGHRDHDHHDHDDHHGDRRDLGAQSRAPRHPG